MKIVYIRDVDTNVTKEDILKRLHMPLDHAYGETIDEMLVKALPLAQPRAFYMEAPIEAFEDDGVVIGGIHFKSKILRKNLEGKEMVYPFLSTGGDELATLGKDSGSMMDEFTVDGIMEALLRRTTRAMAGTLTNALPKNAHVVSVTPGSLVDWPITEQKKLFELFGEEAKKLGVSLTESCLMNPVKSVSGFYYEADKDFHNCQLCQRKDCPTRSAAFDAKLFEDLLDT